MTNNITAKIRKVRPHAITPTYGTNGSACFDLYAAEDVIIGPGETVAVPVGFAVELPEGYEMQIRPRSGISLKTKLRVANSPGCVDSDFRGEVVVLLDSINVNTNEFYPVLTDISGNSAYTEGYVCYAENSYIVRRGDRIAQAAVVPIPRVNFVEVDGELMETERGAGGFGSTGTRKFQPMFTGHTPFPYFKPKEDEN